jgi:hypothetical protein
LPNEGYIKLYRSIMDNKLWYTRPFAKGQAWVELLMMANHEDNDIMFGNQSIHIERGSFITSILKLSERWGWSRHRVKDFINFLISLQMVDLKMDNKKSLITIVNYTLYQGNENKKDIVKDNKRTSKGQQKDTNKNEKNEKNDKNLDINKLISCFSPEFQTAFLAYSEMRKVKKCPLTENAAQLVLKKLEKIGVDEREQIEILNNSTMNCWQGVFEIKSGAQGKKPARSVSFNMQEYTDLSVQRLLNEGKDDG